MNFGLFAFIWVCISRLWIMYLSENVVSWNCLSWSYNVCIFNTIDNWYMKICPPGYSCFQRASDAESDVKILLWNAGKCFYTTHLLRGVPQWSLLLLYCDWTLHINDCHNGSPLSREQPLVYLSRILFILFFHCCMITNNLGIHF